MSMVSGEQGVEDGYFPWSADEPMSETALKFFIERGYVVLTSFSTTTETEELRAAAAKIITDFAKNRPSEVSTFSTKKQNETVNGRYFLASATRVSCFLEEKQPENSESPAVNKIGHALHELEPSFRQFTRRRKVAQVVQAVGLQRAALAQSMYIVKGARVGAEVRPHRDATFVRSKRSGPTGACLGLWWALENSTLDNGCLWAVPGSHRDEVSIRFVLNDARDGTCFEGEDPHEYPLDAYVPLPMQQGDLVLLHGSVVHMSKDNTSEKSRHAYSVHVVEEGVADRCWMQRPDSSPFPLLDS